MGSPVAVLDSGALDVAALDRDVRASLVQLRGGGWDVVIPTVVLSEAITGRGADAPVNRVIKAYRTVDSDVDVARRAGKLRHRALSVDSPREPSGIDALVAAHAVAVGEGVVFTSDPEDHRLLLADHPAIAVRAV